MNSNKVWGGGEKWHYETALFLNEAGHDVLVVANRNSDLYKKLQGHEHIRVHSMRITNISFLNPLKLFILRRRFLQHHVYAVILGLSTDVKLGGPAAKMAGVEHIIYRRGSAIPVRNSFFNRYLFRKVLTQIITNSGEIMQNIFMRNPHIIDQNKVQVIYNGVDLEKWPGMDYFKRVTDEKGLLVLGNAGRLVEQKGQGYLIQIARLLKAREIPFRLYIAGSGKLKKELTHACAKHDLQKEIVFLDFVEDIREFLKGLDIYLSTSLHEGSSHVILEAMAAAKPVVAFDVSSMPEMIKDGESGFLVPFGDVEQFTERIIQLRNDPGAMERIGAQARGRVAEKFDFSNNIRSIIKLIEQ
ncbi:MAG: glycosyltransferase family 4 protein [Bacteroidales bacterium]|nr:glycosyltransferase family 4 protein [Bacteroidales bacterium]